jgi:acyl carrier protein
MNREEILHAVRDLIALNFELPAATITPAAALRADLGMDSLALVDLTFFVKQTFGIQDKIQSYQGIITVDDLVTFIEAAQQRAAQP